ncbi:MAG: hypothetical protein RMK89_09710 [Armatimonadota bacterium]|nr:hypothetical protein [Armatimonadota bacterium]MDW8143723.1 hypothetical protein [Armatimonadota bacterium]
MGQNSPSDFALAEGRKRLVFPTNFVRADFPKDPPLYRIVWRHRHS